MKPHLFLILCCICYVGCNSDNKITGKSGTTSSENTQAVREDDIHRALSKIVIGTTDTELVAAIKPIVQHGNRHR